jgi:hypothetical protein
MVSPLARISYRFVAVLWIIVLSYVNHAWSQSDTPQFPTIPQVERVSGVIREQLGGPTPYVMCQDYVNAFYRTCLENRWSCIPQMISCNAAGTSHAVILVQINAIQCVFADPTNGSVIGQVFECSEVRNQNSIGLSGAVCPPGQETCICDRTSVPGGWSITFTNPRFPSIMASAYSEWYFWVTRRMTRLAACNGTCAYTVRMMEEQAAECHNPATRRDWCENFLAAIPRWRFDCLRQCTLVVG